MFQFYLLLVVLFWDRRQLPPMLKTTLNTILFATEPNNQTVEILILGISALASATKH